MDELTLFDFSPIGELATSECAYPHLKAATAYRYGCRCDRCAVAKKIDRTPSTLCNVDGCGRSRQLARGSRTCEDHAGRRVRAPGSGQGSGNYIPIICDICERPAKKHRQSAYPMCNQCVEPARGLVIAARNHGVPWHVLKAWVAAPSCELCRRPLFIGKGKGGAAGFAIDHNHDCCPGSHGCEACVRGLLCGACNTRLGSAEALMRRTDLSLLLSYIQRGSDVELGSNDHNDPRAA